MEKENCTCDKLLQIIVERDRRIAELVRSNQTLESRLAKLDRRLGIETRKVQL